MWCVVDDGLILRQYIHVTYALLMFSSEMDTYITYYAGLVGKENEYYKSKHSIHYDGRYTLHDDEMLIV